MGGDVFGKAPTPTPRKQGIVKARGVWIVEKRVATGEQIKALLKSHAAGDNDLFRSVALQIAAHEATKGNERLAMELRELIDKARRAQQPAGSPRVVPIARTSGELAGLVLASYPSTRLSDMVLENPVSVTPSGDYYPPAATAGHATLARSVPRSESCCLWARRVAARR